MTKHSATERFVWGVLLHLIADWLLQNRWQARYKTNLRHPAATVHSGIHTVLLSLVFPAPVALVLGVLHALIDTRRPLGWWRSFFKQDGPEDGHMGLHVSVWSDQTLHLCCLALAALVTRRFDSLR